MRILHLSTFDEEGGAARAASRLHRGQHALGQDSWMAVRKKVGDGNQVILCGGEGALNKAAAMFRPYIDAFPLKFCSEKRNTPWNVAWLPNRLDAIVSKISPDIIHSHWVGNGFLSINNLKRIQSKFVWTLHDSWAFTGGCHVIQECTSFQSKCGNCPQLGSERKLDLSALGHLRKRLFYEKNQPTFIAPSRWMAEQAKSSSLLAEAEIEIIPNGLDTSIFHPVDKRTAREILHLPTDKKIIMFGAMSATSDPNKGFEKLKGVLSALKHTLFSDEIEVVIFGAGEPINRPDFGFRTTYLGRLHDDVSLAVAYSAADVVCVPSIQESFGQVAVEAMSCGTPVVAFATSGLLDIIEHEVTGYLALPYDELDFAQGITFLLSNQSRYKAIAAAARSRAVKCFDIAIVAHRHLAIYEELRQLSISMP